MRRDYCASGPSRSVTEEELSDTDRGGPTGKEGEHAHRILDKGSKSYFTTQSMALLFL